MTAPTKIRGDATATWARLTVGLMLAAAWLSSGLQPGRAAVAGARAPSDFATDFVPAARLCARTPKAVFAPLDVMAGNAAALRLGAPPYMAVGVPFGAHPPPAVLLVAALTPLGFGKAALAWLLLSLVSLALVAWVAAKAAFPDPAEPRPGITRPLLLFVLFTAWPPVLHNIEKGQWSLVLAGLLAGTWWAFTRRRDGWAGALIGLAAAFKVMPLLVLMAFIGLEPSRRRKIVGAALATLAGAVILSAAILGPRAWIDFVRAAPVNTRGWQTGPANTLSLWGALARLLVGGPFARPIITPALGAPIAVVLWAIATAALIILAARLALRANTRPSRWPPALSPAPEMPAQHPPAPAMARSFAAWCALAVVLGPLSWTHGAAMLLLPLALLGGAARGNGPWPTHAVLVLGTLAAALTVPRSTLFSWAGVLPVSPARGLVLGLHLTAVLALVVLAVIPARRAGPPRVL